MVVSLWIFTSVPKNLVRYMPHERALVKGQDSFKDGKRHFPHSIGGKCLT